MNEQDWGTRKEPGNAGPEAEYPYAESDEISLIDLWLVLMRRKRVVVVIVILFVLGGIAFWATKARQERYVTSIEIGRIMTDSGGMQRIEAREAVETRLRNAILPSLRNAVAEEFDKTLNGLPRVDIRVPEEEGTGDFVFLESTVNPKEKEIVDALHQGVVNQLAKVHDRMFELYEKRFSVRLSNREIDLRELTDKDRFRLQELRKESALSEARSALAERQEAFPIQQQQRKHELAQLKDALEAAKDTFEVKKQNLEHKIRQAEERIDMLGEERQRLKERMDRISVEKNLLAGQEEDIRQWMNSARESQQDLYESVGKDTNMALATLMLGNQAENARKQLADLQRQLSIELPERRAKLEARLEQNARQTVEARETVAELKSELEKLKQDHARDISKKERSIAQLRDTIEKAASDHQRAVESAERRIERLKVELKELHSDHSRKIERKEGELELFATNGERMEKTRAPEEVVPAETIGRGGKMIGALSLILGLMVGVFGAFFSEFIAQAKKAARERKD